MPSGDDRRTGGDDRRIRAVPITMQEYVLAIDELIKQHGADNAWKYKQQYDQSVRERIVAAERLQPSWGHNPRSQSVKAMRKDLDEFLSTKYWFAHPEEYKEYLRERNKGGGGGLLGKFLDPLEKFRDFTGIDRMLKWGVTHKNLLNNIAYAAVAFGAGALIASYAGAGAAAAGAGAGGAGAGGGAAGAAGAGGAGAAAGGGFFSKYGSFLIGEGANLIGGYLDNKAARDAEKDRLKQLLRTLSPENIAALERRFLPQVMAQLNPLNQQAVAGLRSRAAQAGVADSPFSLTSEAGLRGQLANNAVQTAFNQAFSLAKDQAGAIGDQPNTPSNTGQLISNAGNRFLDFYARTRSPYQVPGNNNTNTTTTATPPFNQAYPAGQQFPYTPPFGVPKNPYLSYPGRQG